MIKFIGECYNFKLLHTDTLLDLLYRLMNIALFSFIPVEYNSAEDTSEIYYQWV